jgi:hypothetical protein
LPFLLGPGMISLPLGQWLDSFFPAVKLKLNIVLKKVKSQIKIEYCFLKVKTWYRNIMPKEQGHRTGKIV